MVTEPLKVRDPEALVADARGEVAPPVISVVGRKNSGKTTLLERLIPELKRRGLRVAVVKHDAHGFQMDHEGKDTYRLMESGADAVAISGPTETALRIRTAEETPLRMVLARLGEGFDLVLTEGYRRSRVPKVEVAGDAPLLCGPEDNLVAVVAASEVGAPVPRFHPQDVRCLAAFLLAQLPCRLPRSGGGASDVE